MTDRSSEGYAVGERRPIAARDKPFFRDLAARFARAGVSPNAISVGGMVSGVLAGICLAASSRTSDITSHILWAFAAIFIQLRLIANLLDGMVAVNSGNASPVGELYNEIPDRVSDACVLIGAGLAVGGDLVLGCLATAVAIFTAYVRAAAKVAGAPQDFCGPMAKQHRMALMTGVCLFMAVTPERFHPVLSFDLGGRHVWGVAALALVVVIVGGLWTCVRRIRRASIRLKGGTV